MTTLADGQGRQKGKREPRWPDLSVRPLSQAGDGFGVSVATSGPTAIVRAPFDDDNGHSSTYSAGVMIIFGSKA